MSLLRRIAIARQDARTKKFFELNNLGKHRLKNTGIEVGDTVEMVGQIAELNNYKNLSPDQRRGTVVAINWSASFWKSSFYYLVKWDTHLERFPAQTTLESWVKLVDRKSNSTLSELFRAIQNAIVALVFKLPVLGNGDIPKVFLKNKPAT